MIKTQKYVILKDMDGTRNQISRLIKNTPTLCKWHCTLKNPKPQ